MKESNNIFFKCFLSAVVLLIAAVLIVVVVKMDGESGGVSSKKTDGSSNSLHTSNSTISAGNSYTVGLKKDGTVVAVGENEFGECDVSDWSDIYRRANKFAHSV